VGIERREAMAKLTVEAAFGSTKLVDSSNLTATLCVSVTDDGGQPVNGLSEKQFTLTVLQTGFLGGEAGDIYLPIEIVSVNQFLITGFYHVSIKPSAPFAWGTGRIIVGLAVSRAHPSGLGGSLPSLFFDRGQTVVAFEVEPAAG
jgi:hypothetical protein